MSSVKTAKLLTQNKSRKMGYLLTVYSRNLKTGETKNCHQWKYSGDYWSNHSGGNKDLAFTSTDVEVSEEEVSKWSDDVFEDRYSPGYSDHDLVASWFEENT